MDNLVKAVYNGDLEKVKILLADPSISLQLNDNNRIPFYWACRKNHIEIVKLLMKDSRIDINKPDNHGHTPLIVAVYRKYFKIVKLLLKDDRIDVNKSNNDGMTPFMVATINFIEHSEDDIPNSEYLEIVKLLLKDPRVDINKPDNDRITPFTLALQKENSVMINLLEPLLPPQYEENIPYTLKPMSITNNKKSLFSKIFSRKLPAYDEGNPPPYNSLDGGYINKTKTLRKTKKKLMRKTKTKLMRKTKTKLMRKTKSLRS